MDARLHGLFRMSRGLRWTANFIDGDSSHGYYFSLFSMRMVPPLPKPIRRRRNDVRGSHK